MYSGDYLGSDDLGEVLAESLRPSRNAPGPSRPNDHAFTRDLEEQAQLEAWLVDLYAQIASMRLDMKRLAQALADMEAKAEEAKSRLTAVKTRIGPGYHQTGGGSRRASIDNGGTDFTGKFEWSKAMKQKMMQVFRIREFRLCQEGVCNANMEGRDIVCIMPTGGGKSLTYQLPALLSPGCTLVISPLISLITDQILHLQEAGVEAVKLTGGTSPKDAKSIELRLTSSATRSRGVIRPPSGADEPDIKLCYVTPEKIAKSKPFLGILEKMVSAGMLARIVIDEAHCVSQLGHDFRPDYKNLSILRKLFPRVPIMALSATCPPKVLQEILSILRMKPVTNGTAANRDGTVEFSSSLYRKNLHYRVVPKPASANAAIKAMADFIMQHHRNQSGIVYCLSKKDTEAVATGLQEISGGVIQTGVYHSDVGDAEKERLHERWRAGEVKVVCATIAFGLGIDKGDVRFVLHHSMSKSLEGFYQESGRAGRDGEDSDCVLYFRPQDATRLASLTARDAAGKEKLHGMLNFAIDKKECRNIAFASYFCTSTSLALSAWSDTGSPTLDRCGHCDNCTRSPESMKELDVTMDAWRLCQVAEVVGQEGGRLTVAALTDLARGNAGGSFAVAGGRGKRGRGRAEEKVTLDLEVICQGKVTLNKDDVEMLIIELMLSKYLQEEYHSTAYGINVYVTLGPESHRLLRMNPNSITSGNGLRIKLCVLNKREKPAKSTPNNGTKRNQQSGNAALKTPSSGSSIPRQRSLAEVVAGRSAAKVGRGKPKELVAESEDVSELSEMIDLSMLAEDEDEDEQAADNDEELMSFIDDTDYDQPVEEDDDFDGVHRHPRGKEGGHNHNWKFNLRDDEIEDEDGGKPQPSSSRMPNNKRHRKTVFSSEDEAGSRPSRKLSTVTKARKSNDSARVVDEVFVLSDSD